MISNIGGRPSEVLGGDMRFRLGAVGLLAKAAEVGQWPWLGRLAFFEQEAELGWYS